MSFASLHRRRLLAALATGIAVTRAMAQGRPRYVLVTGAAGGAFHEYGPALAQVLAAHAGLDLDVQPSGGSNDNIRAIARGEADLGLVNLGPAHQAWEGTRAFAKDGPQRSLRALFPMYETPFGVVALRAKAIASLADLRGRTVGVGPAGGPGEIFFKGLAKALAIEAKIATGSPTDLARRVIQGEIDAFWFGAGQPVGAFVEVLEKADGVVLGLTEAEIAAFRETFAYFAPSEIPAGTYKGQDRPLKTASVWNFVLASDRMPEEAAYAITRSALEHADDLRAALPAAAGTLARHAASNSFLPFHPGAARFLREAGAAIPAALVPG